MKLNAAGPRAGTVYVKITLDAAEHTYWRTYRLASHAERGADHDDAAGSGGAAAKPVADLLAWLSDNFGPQP